MFVAVVVSVVVGFVGNGTVFVLETILAAIVQHIQLQFTLSLAVTLDFNAEDTEAACEFHSLDILLSESEPPSWDVLSYYACKA